MGMIEDKKIAITEILCNSALTVCSILNSDYDKDVKADLIHMQEELVKCQIGMIKAQHEPPKELGIGGVVINENSGESIISLKEISDIDKSKLEIYLNIKE